jgi:predicted alpha/beta superfamily hydrolase
MNRSTVLIVLLTLTLLLPACSSDNRKSSTAGPTVKVLSPPLAMPGLDRTRTLRIYLPPSYALSDRRYPVIYMHDGQNLFDDATSYAGEWGVDEAMDALARTHRFEAIVVGIDNGADKRMQELSAWPHAQFGAAEGAQYLSFLVDVVKPHIDQHYRTQPGRNATAIIGSSMGGLASHYAIHARPDVFGMAGVLSPSYWVAPQLYAEARSKPLAADTRVYLYAGGKEGAETTGDAWRMHEQLAATTPPQNLTLSIVEAADHNEAAWRAEFPRVAAWLFDLKPVD